MIPTPVAQPNHPTELANDQQAQQPSDASPQYAAMYGQGVVAPQPGAYAPSHIYPQPYIAQPRPTWRVILGVLAVVFGAYMLWHSGFFSGNTPTTSQPNAPQVSTPAPRGVPATSPGGTAISGTWVGAGQATTSSGTSNFGVLITLQSNNSQLVGSGEVCFPGSRVGSAQISGQVNGNTLDLTWDFSGGTANMTGQLNSNGTISFLSQSASETDEGEMAPGSQNDFANVCGQLG